MVNISLQIQLKMSLLEFLGVSIVVSYQIKKKNHIKQEKKPIIDFP